jgi:hypothetical protein
VSYLNINNEQNLYKMICNEKTIYKARLSCKFCIHLLDKRDDGKVEEKNVMSGGSTGATVDSVLPFCTSDSDNAFHIYITSDKWDDDKKNCVVFHDGWEIGAPAKKAEEVKAEEGEGKAEEVVEGGGGEGGRPYYSSSRRHVRAPSPRRRWF